MKLPFDILYNIFFQVNDIKTLNNLELLNKETYLLFKDYNTVKVYKVQIIANELFEYLYKFPLNERELKLDKNEMVIIVYYLYKSFIFSEMEKYFGSRYSKNIEPSLTNIIMIQGPKYINKNIEIYVNNGEIALRSKNKSIIDNFDTSGPFQFLKDRMLMFESILALN